MPLPARGVLLETLLRGHEVAEQQVCIELRFLRCVALHESVLNLQAKRSESTDLRVLLWCFDRALSHTKRNIAAEAVFFGVLRCFKLCVVAKASCPELPRFRAPTYSRRPLGKLLP